MRTVGRHYLVRASETRDEASEEGGGRVLYGDFLLRARDGFLHGMIAGETRGIWEGGLLYDDALLMSLLPHTAAASSNSLLLLFCHVW